MRRYYLHTRHHGIFYAELVTTEGCKLTARSTGTRDRDEALLTIAEWLKSGIPTGHLRKPRPMEVATGLEAILKSIRKTGLNGDDALQIVSLLKAQELIDIPVVKAGKGNVLFTDFLEKFWDYEKSPYVREKLAHGHSIGKTHCYDMSNRVRSAWIPALKGRTLSSITKADLKEFSLALSDKGLAPGSINRTMLVGTTALSWAFQEGMIPTNPTGGLVRFSGKTKKRGVLTPKEAAAVFSIPWKDKRAYAGNLLSITTGLRSGEVLALRNSDISLVGNVLFIKHSWSSADGLKTPKNGEDRKVPLLLKVREKLVELIQENPHKVVDPFVFYGALANKPLDEKVLLNGLKDACREAGIDPVAKGIVFHSHRHYYAARMADKMTAEQVSRITGHKSMAVFEEYADHVIAENLEAAGAIGAEVFGNILLFEKGA
jgi:integrase